MKHLIFSFSGLLHSYAQIFFSKNLWFGGMLCLVTFFDLGAGLAGVLSVLTVQLTAVFFDFNRALIKDGSYSYNSLLVGLGLGVFFEFSGSLVLVLAVASLLTFLATLWFLKYLSNRGLPYLSIPFLIGIWVIHLGLDNFSAIELRQKELFSLAIWMPDLFENTTEFIARLPFANVIYLYLRSLGAILFQFNDLAGILIALGLIFYSRIAFVVSVFGFAVGYAFYQFMEGDFSTLIYTYIGFNFILTAIALGGFFVVPSRRSFLLLLLTIPLIALLLSAFHTLFSYVHLPLYSLPFNIVVLLFLTAMFQRTKASGLNLVTIQHFSPEKNQYRFQNYNWRFQQNTFIHIALPVMGEWYISQGHKGDITHKEDWQHAWDFDIRNNGKTFQEKGFDLEDYHCFNMPVIAPAAGWIVEISDNIPDNEIGKVNLENNWGNTIIIKHSEYLFSKLSHLKRGTFQVKKGDYVQKGQLLARLGNSGRSPEPHLHFQLQSTPYIGSKTLRYPISHYLKKENEKVDFQSFEIPKEGDTVCNVQTTPLLTETFRFTPGKKFSVEGKSDKNTQLETWEAHTSPTNQTYLWCPETKSTAWFVNNGAVFYFTAFEGSKKSLLYLFYLGAYKVLLGYYKNADLRDRMSLEEVLPSALRIIHDFTAPFFQYARVDYHFKFLETDSEHSPTKIAFESNCEATIFGKTQRKLTYRFDIEKDRISFNQNEKQFVICVLDERDMVFLKKSMPSHTPDP